MNFYVNRMNVLWVKQNNTVRTHIPVRDQTLGEIVEQNSRTLTNALNFPSILLFFLLAISSKTFRIYYDCKFARNHILPQNICYKALNVKG